MNPSNSEIRELAFGSSEYAGYIALRDKVLRQPLGLEFSEVDLEKERRYRHFGLFSGEEILATVMIAPHAEGTFQVRQMAVDFEQHGKGCGRLLLSTVETRLRHEGINHLFLHARDTAIGFYERLGYIPVGERFTEVGISHQKMDKQLS